MPSIYVNPASMENKWNVQWEMPINALQPLLTNQIAHQLIGWTSSPLGTIQRTYKQVTCIIWILASPEAEGTTTVKRMNLAACRHVSMDTELICSSLTKKNDISGLLSPRINNHHLENWMSYGEHWQRRWTMRIPTIQESDPQCRISIRTNCPWCILPKWPCRAPKSNLGKLHALHAKCSQPTP